ncbi:MAG: hypothetical protein H0T43_02645 [Solirubrobacterales bacterium]|nr:hypothetical protein [Solirubrobacterales bacterium]
MRYVLLYESAPDALTKVPEHFPAHSAWADEFHDRGDLLLIGAFANPQEQGSMAIFTSREAAEASVAGDPFVRNGVVSGHEIREWQEVYSSAAGKAA